VLFNSYIKSDWVKFNRGGTALKTMRTILTQKGRTVWTISPEATVLEALKKMADKNVGALLVMDENDEHLYGIISERDVARKLDIQGRHAADTKVKEIMTHEIVALEPQHTAEEAMAVMIDKHIRHLPVIENNKLMGLISIGDVVKAVIKDQKFTIDQLVKYIVGEY